MIRELLHKTIKIKKRFYTISDRFANMSYSTNLDCYRTRNQKNVSKIQQDIAQGKLVEFVVWDYISSLGYDVTKPDTSVYKKNKKSYKADIKTPNFNIHIKSQTVEQAKKYTDSWIFQPEDPLTKNPLKKDIIILCSINYDENIVEIKGVVYAHKVKKLYKDPKIFFLKGKKIALYCKDINKK